MIFTLFLVFILFKSSNSEVCNKRITNNESGDCVCVCNSSYCDTVPKLNLSIPNSYQLYTTSRKELGFTTATGSFLKLDDTIEANKIRINRQEKYQNIIGFGGAFTDSTGINILSLPQEAQNRLLQSYFGEDGIGYSLCRVPIGGTDFSTRPYTYDDNPGDLTLEKFNLQEEDFLYKIPLIKKAQELRQNLPFKLFSTAWSAPKWMKTSDDIAGISSLKEEYYQLWADYYIKFFQAYRNQGIEFWGITTQNEPIDGFLNNSINSMGWTPEQLNQWIGNNFGPNIRKSEFKNLKIMTFDDNRYVLPLLPLLLDNETALSFLDGIATHWYVDQFLPWSFLNFTQSDKKDLFLIQTEACNGYLHLFGLEPAVVLGSWERGQNYLDSIMNYLKHGASGWMDWNMALNTSGGPLYINNPVDSPIIVNAELGEFYKQPMYYTLGHFSKFLITDSIRIGVTHDELEGLEVLAFERPDNLTTVMISNKTPKEITVEVEDTSIARFNVSAYSINTLIY